MRACRSLTPSWKTCSPNQPRRSRKAFRTLELILITSQEIDELGEADNMAQARLQIDGVLSHLRRGVRVLADHGIKSIVLVADHGHLFADEIGDDTKIESPGGKVEDMHRRVWVASEETRNRRISERHWLRWEWTASSILRPRGHLQYSSRRVGREPIFTADCLHKN